MQGDQAHCLAAGMDDYISKPVKQEDFARALKWWVPRQNRERKNEPQQHRTGNEKAASIDIPDASPSPISSSPPNTSSALSAEVVARLRALEDATEPSLVSQIFTSFLSDGAERIRGLRRSLDGSDTQLLRKTAHALRGASANIGAQHMADIAQQLEALGKSGSTTGAVALIEEIEAEFERIKAEITELSILTAPPSHIA
jgi:two-component system, sensor histidine kinase and response regulator